MWYNNFRVIKMESIGERIKRRRLELGLSVDDLAQKLGKNRATIYRYESEDIEKLPVSIVMPLAEALQVSPAYIMGWDIPFEGIQTHSEDPEQKKVIFFVDHGNSPYEGYYMSFTETLIFLRVKLRNKLETSQRSLAKYLGISIEAYRQIENGSTVPNEGVLLSLSSLFGVPLYNMYYKAFDGMDVPFNKRHALIPYEPQILIYSYAGNYNLQEGLKRKYGAEVAHCIEDQFSKLDDVDKGRVMCYIEQLLEGDKYKGIPLDHPSD